MAFILSSTSIRPPTSFNDTPDSLMAQQRTLDGQKHRDYFGTLKRVWVLNFENVNLADFTTIYNLYLAYIANDIPLTWQATETNYTVAATTVHVDIQTREFKIRGSDYLSNFSLVLTEA